MDYLFTFLKVNDLFNYEFIDMFYDNASGFIFFTFMSSSFISNFKIFNYMIKSNYLHLFEKALENLLMAFLIVNQYIPKVKVIKSF